MNVENWISKIIDSKVKKTMPILSFPSTQLLDISVKQLIADSDLQANGMKAIADRVDSLAAVSLMDLSVEAECFGSTIRLFDDEVPAVIGEIVSTLEEAEALKVPKVFTARTGIYIKAIEKAVKLITDRPIFAGVIGSYSLAGRLVGVQESMIYCYTDPDMLSIVLEKCTEFLIEYILEFKKVGANGVVIAEPLTGLLSPTLAEEFSHTYIKKIIDSTQDENFAVIYHNCGNSVAQMVEGIYTVGAMGYHFGNAIDMRDVVPKAPKDVLVMGNIDPSSQFRNGTTESIREETLKLMSALDKYPNFVISSGCDIPPMAQWANIDAYFAAVKEFYDNKSK